jgi:hypothetical protein
VEVGCQFRIGRLLVVCAAAVALVGCQEKRTTVKGLVTLDGKPLTVREGMRGTVVFQPTASSGTTLSGLIDARGRYQLALGGSAAVTPSIYRVTVSAIELVPSTAELPSTGKLVTPAKYASAIDSGFQIEVLPGENEVNLPLVSDVEHSRSHEPNAPDATDSGTEVVDTTSPNASPSD